MKFILISPKNRTTYNFRGDLIKSIIDMGNEVIVTGPNYDEIDKIEALGVRFVHIPLNKTGLNIWSDLKYFLALKRLFSIEKPDATLGYTIKPVIYGSIAAKCAKVKNINAMITGLGYVFTAKTGKAKIIRFLVSALYRLSLWCADKVIFQNPDDQAEFYQLNLVNAKKCEIVNGSGVNMKKYIPKDYPQSITFLMISRILYSKGICEYLEAARLIKLEYPDFRFMLLGALENMQDSLDPDRLQKYIHSGVIEYFKETDDVSFYYQQCSVYVLPSYREGTPRTVLEAMAMKRPIVTTDAPGCRETVVDGKNGFLVPIQNVEKLVEKLKWFIEHPEDIESMGKESYQLCCDKFDVLKVNEKMIEIINMKSV